MGLTIKRVKTPNEKKKSDNLLQEVYEKAFGFDYATVARLSPDFNKVPFIAYSENKFDVIATATVSFETNGYYPSEWYFGYRIPEQFRQQNLLEIGRLAKVMNVKMTPEEEGYALLALLLAIKEYSINNNIDAWVATVHSKLLNEIRGLGIKVEVLAENGAVESEITRAMGIYTKDIHLIYATMPDSYAGLAKFEYLLKNGTIAIDIAQTAL
jgi:hypothetical protein